MPDRRQPRVRVAAGKEKTAAAIVRLMLLLLDQLESADGSEVTAERLSDLVPEPPKKPKRTRQTKREDGTHE